MIFEETALPGAWLLTPEPAADPRGWFARTYDREAFAARGIALDVAVGASSFNDVRGTVRGMHFQATPHGEAKLVRVAAGAILDVVIDLRAGSPTFGRWAAAELSAANRRALYVPRGFAHGFQALVDAPEVVYLLDGTYTPAAVRGYRHDDPAFGIPWPLPVAAIADADRAWPAFMGAPA